MLIQITKLCNRLQLAMRKCNGGRGEESLLGLEGPGEQHQTTPIPSVGFVSISQHTAVKEARQLPSRRFSISVIEAGDAFPITGWN
jgi:hypothetical protein